MADQEICASARQVGSVRNDSQLPELIAAHRQPEGALHLSLPGFEYISGRDVEVSGSNWRLAETDSPSLWEAPPRAFCRNVHLEFAHTRLQQAPYLADEESSRFQKIYGLPPPQQQRGEAEGSSPLLSNEEKEYLDRETSALQRLAEEGVPLLYAPHLMLEVWRNPAKFEAMVRPFFSHPPLGEDDHERHGYCFERQHLRWQQFREWQANSRGVDTRSQDFDKYLAKIKTSSDPEERAAAAAGEDDLKSTKGWKDFQRALEHDRQWLRESDCSSNVTEHEAAIKARLSEQQGFTAAFTLSERFLEQDRLTTWIEYLAFESWWLPGYRSALDTAKTQRDEMYAALQAKASLRPHETPAYLGTRNSLAERRVESEMAWKRLDDAARALRELPRPARRRRRRRRQRQQQANAAMRADAEREMVAAEAELDMIQRRDVLVAEFLGGMDEFYGPEEVVESHVRLLHWVTDRLAEVMAERYPERARRRKRKVAFLVADEEEEEERGEGGGQLTRRTKEEEEEEEELPPAKKRRGDPRRHK